MAIYYFADDGNWGDASGLVIIDENDYTFTNEMWELISDAGDRSRMEYVQHFKDVADGSEEHDWTDSVECAVCNLTKEQVN